MAKSGSLSRIADVDIDRNGVFKYILIEVKSKDGTSKKIVRGYSWAQYHGKQSRRVTDITVRD